MYNFYCLSAGNLESKHLTKNHCAILITSLEKKPKKISGSTHSDRKFKCLQAQKPMKLLILNSFGTGLCFDVCEMSLRLEVTVSNRMKEKEQKEEGEDE